MREVIMRSIQWVSRVEVAVGRQRVGSKASSLNREEKRDEKISQVNSRGSWRSWAR